MITLSLFFDWLLTVSFRSSVLVLVIFILQFALRRWLGARARYALWFPVLLVLLTPVFPQSSWSVESAFATFPKAHSGLPSVLEAPAQPLSPPFSGQTAPLQTPTAPIDWPRLALQIWLSGSAAILVVLGISYARTLRRYRNTRLPVGDELIAQIACIADEIGLKRVPRIWVSPAIQSPAVAGLLRPVLLLPSQFDRQFTTSEARLILQHELTHLRRHDLPLNALMCLLVALHWINPLLWLAFFKVRIDREAACDFQVPQNSTPRLRSDYGHALLKMESALAHPRLGLGFVGIFQRGAALRSRIRFIVAPHHPHPAMKLFASVSIALMTFLGVTRAATEPADSPEIILETRFIEISGERNEPASADKAFAEAFEGTPVMNAAAGALRGVLDDPNYQVTLRKLSQKKGVDLMSAPRMITKSGQKASVEVTREFALPPEQKPLGKKVGVMLDVIATVIEEGNIQVAMNPRIVEYEGLVEDANGEKKPVFTERKANARVTLKSGQTAVLDLGTRTDRQQVGEAEVGKATHWRTDHFTRRAFVFITVRLAKTAKKAANGFTTGQSAFRAGDSIRITRVQRGDGFMTVTADYELASADSAQMDFYITSPKESQPVKTAGTQSKTITKGKGTVVLHHPEVHDGLPHVSFYDLKSHQAIGGIYFGTEHEAEASRKLDLSYMLDGCSSREPQGTSGKTSEGQEPARRFEGESHRYSFKKAKLGDVLRSLASDAGLNVISIPEDHPANGKLMTLNLDASPLQALKTISTAYGLNLLREGEVWHIRPADDPELIGRSYPRPKTTVTAEAILGDIRSILDIDDNRNPASGGKSTTAKENVSYKKDEDTFYVMATRLQHSWVNGYFKGLGGTR